MNVVLTALRALLPYILPALALAWMVWSYTDTKHDLQRVTQELTESREAMRSMEATLEKNLQLDSYKEEVSLSLSKLERELATTTKSFSDKMKDIANQSQSPLSEGGDNEEIPNCTDNSLNSDVSRLLKQQLKDYH